MNEDLLQLEIIKEDDRHRLKRTHRSPPMSKPHAITTLISLGLLLAIGLSIEKAAAAEPESPGFQFVQMCDTQLGFGADGYDQDVQSFRKAVRKINAMKPAFVVICGDLVNKPQPQAFADFKKVMAELEVPCYCVAGNHDVGQPATVASLETFRNTIGKDFYSFKHAGWTFLVVNTVLWKAPIDKETAAQDEWFIDSLKHAKAESSPVIVMGHHPLFLKQADEKEEYFNIPPQKRAEILGQFPENGVVAMLTGHTHRLVENEYEGIHFLSGETTSKNFDKRPFGFRLWSVDPAGNVNNRFVPLDE